MAKKNSKSKSNVKPVTLLSYKEVMCRTSVSKGYIYKLMEKGDFPKSISIGVRRVAWIESEIDNWIADRIVTARKGAA